MPPGLTGPKVSLPPGNVPGARLRAITWIDPGGIVWPFGGLGFDSTGAQGALNDLWEYSAGQWRWSQGSDTKNASGTYGTKGIAAPANVAGGRYAGIAWIDSLGNLWQFGGVGYDSTCTQGGLNDLWRYTP
jgi:hypothetical protein